MFLVRVAVGSSWVALVACAEGGDAPAPVPVPMLEALPLDAWGVSLQAPPGTTVRNLTPTGAARTDETALATLQLGAPCDVELTLLSSSKDDLDEMHTAAASRRDDDRRALRVLINESGPSGYRWHDVLTTPLGEAHTVNVATVVGERMIACTAGQLSAAEAACALASCSSIGPR